MAKSTLNQVPWMLKQSLASIAGHVHTYHVAIIWLLFTVGSIGAIHGGVLHPECRRFMPHYLSERPLLNKVFDSDVNDWRNYQARELSYFFDLIDCYFIDLGVRCGVPHLISLTYYLFVGLIVLTVWYFCASLQLDRFLTLCIIVLFLTSPSVFLSGFYFRSAKIGVSLMAVVFWCTAYRMLAPRIPASRPPAWQLPVQLAILAITSIAAALFDRQGVFLVAMACLFFALRLVSVRDRVTLLVFSVCLGSFGFSSLYNHWIAPKIIHHLNGYRPNFAFQHLDLHDLVERPLYYLHWGSSLFLKTTKFLLGNLTTVQTVAIAVPAIIWLASLQSPWQVRNLKTGKDQLFPWASAVVFTLMGCLIVSMNMLMLLKHPMLLWWEDIQRIYYWLPVCSLIVMMIPLAVQALVQKQWLPKRAVATLLALLVTCNLISLPTHLHVFRTGHMVHCVAYTPQLLKALTRLSDDRFTPPAEVTRDEVYQLFRSRWSKTAVTQLKS